MKIKQIIKTTSLPVLSILCICIIEILDDTEIYHLEVLTLCFDFQSRAHVSARSKKNIRDTFFWVEHKIETYFERGRNIQRVRSKQTSRTVKRYLERRRNILRTHSKHTSSTVKSYPENQLGSVQMMEKVSEQVGMNYPEIPDSGYVAQLVNDLFFP